MAPEHTTQLDTDEDVASTRAARPGLLLVFVGASPRMEAFPVAGGGVELGRTPGSALEHPSISRRHARIARTPAGWSIEDFGSSNGTFVDGVRVAGRVEGVAPRVLRVGSAVFLFRSDVSRFAAGLSVNDGVVVGPTLAAVLARVERLAQTGGLLHVTGESGSGKEIVARAFHRAGPRANGPFVAVNCAAIPPALAERLLFGARRGAFSGADADADGYVQAADGGVLFLDEIGDLDASVQAKLLRVIEAKEVLPLGAVRPQTVAMSLCTATMRSLSDDVRAGRFREDLYFRIGRPAVAVPPLRERACEIPALVVLELARLPRAVAPSASFIEACALRAWPGNVRELLQHVREAASAVLGSDRPVVRAEHLPAEELLPHPPGPARSAVHAAAGTPEHRALVEEALAAESFNVSAAARRLGVHRTHLRRWIARYGLG
jgi:transcriptional regulator with PAS, ATPase and Fis domain